MITGSSYQNGNGDGPAVSSAPLGGPYKPTTQAPRIRLNVPQPTVQAESDGDMSPGEASDAEGEDEISDNEDVPMVSSSRPCVLP